MALPDPHDLDTRVTAAWIAAGGVGDDEAWRARRLYGRGELERALELALTDAELDAALVASARAHLDARPAVELRARTRRRLDQRGTADVPLDTPATGLRRLMQALGPLPAPAEVDDTALDKAIDQLLAAADGPVPRRRLERAICHAAGVALVDDVPVATDRRRWLPASGGRPRHADLWVTTGPDPQTVLLLDPGRETAPGAVVHEAVLVDTRLDDASWLHLRLEPGDTTWGVPVRACLDVQHPVPAHALARRVARLTTAGLLALDRSNLGLLPDDRYGVPAHPGASAPDPPGAAALAALAVDDVEEEDDEDEPRLAIVGTLDAAWPAPIVLDDRTTLVVDLLGGTSPPTVVVADGGDAAAAPATLRSGNTAVAAGALALAEARVARRPYGLWVLDAALAAARLEAAAGRGYAALGALAHLRAAQLADRLDDLPERTVARWDPDDDTLRLLSTTLREIAAATADRTVAARLDGWAATFDATGFDDSDEATAPVGELVTSLPRVTYVPVDLDLLAAALGDAPPMVVAEQDAGTLVLRLPLRPAIRRAAQGADAEQLALAMRGGDQALPPVWLQAFEPDTGIVRWSVPLLLDGDELRGTPPAGIVPATSVVRRRPTKVVEPLELLGDLLDALDDERAWVARLLLNAADGFAAPATRTLLLRGAQAAVEDRRGAVAEAVTARASALGTTANPGRLPSGPSAATALIARCRIVRDALAASAPPAGETRDDIRRLDDLVH